MNYDRAPWVRYRRTTAGKESKVGAVAQLVWPLMLKAAIDGKGRIEIARGLTPDRQLFRCFGRRPYSDERFIRNALADLESVGMVKFDRTDDGVATAIVIADWHEFAPCGRRGLGKKHDFTWSRLFGPEPPEFAALDMLTRGFAACLMRLADDTTGEVNVDPAIIIARLGWWDDRWIRWQGFVPAFLADLKRVDYLVAEEGAALGFIRNFARMQPAPTETNGPEDSSRVVSESSVTRKRGGSEAAVTSQRGVSQMLPNPAQPLNSPPQERTNERTNDPPKAPQGGQGPSLSLFEPPEPEPTRTRPAAKRRRMPSGGAPPPGGYPPWFERIWLAHPGRRGGTRGNKSQAYAVAIELAGDLGGEAALVERVLAHLAWRATTTEWRKGIGVRDVCRYLWHRDFDEERITDPLAYLAPEDADAPAWRKAELAAKARHDVAASAEREAKVAAEKARAAEDPVAKFRAFVLCQTSLDNGAERLGRAFRRTGEAWRDEIWCEVLTARLAEFQAAHPAAALAELPQMLREFVLADPARAAGFVRSPAIASPPTAIPPTATPAQAIAPSAPAPGGRRWIPAASWPPAFADPPAAAALAARHGPQKHPAMAALAARLEAADAKLRAMERRFESTARASPKAAGLA
jgi:hypothetical protein